MTRWRARSARPIVVLGSFLEFLPLMSLLAAKYTADTLPYHFIVPSLPGYTYSSTPPVNKTFQVEDIARLMVKLMAELGFERYIATGGDIGSRVARVVCATAPACRAVHLNFCLMSKAPLGLTDDDIDDWER